MPASAPAPRAAPSTTDPPAAGARSARGGARVPPSWGHPGFFQPVFRGPGTLPAPFRRPSVSETRRSTPDSHVTSPFRGLLVPNSLSRFWKISLSAVTELRFKDGGRSFWSWQIVSRVALGSMGLALWGQRRLTSTRGCLSFRQGCRKADMCPLLSVNTWSHEEEPHARCHEHQVGHTVRRPQLRPVGRRSTLRSGSAADVRASGYARPAAGFPHSTGPLDASS